jgi:hypothetical protein
MGATYTCQACGGRDQRCCAQFSLGGRETPGTCTNPLQCAFNPNGSTCTDVPVGVMPPVIEPRPLPLPGVTP